MLSVLFMALYDKEYVVNQERGKQMFDIKMVILLLITSTMLETLVHIVTVHYYNFSDTDILYNILTFIPLSFLYEIIFDFFHYCSHRMEHHKSIYKYTHKLHHKYQYPIIIFTHCHHPLDLIISNAIPHMLTMMCIPKISLFTYSSILIYKVFIEMTGHTGKQTNTSSFPQCIWLPRLFNIELKIKNHDDHHIYSTCNYAKRFSLWDKVFGTFKE